MSSQQLDSVFWLSPAQAAVWSGQTGGPAWNAVAAVSIIGPIQLERLRTAIRAVTQRNEILRTVFLTQSAMKLPFQKILESSDPAFELLDLTGVSNHEQQEQLEWALQDGLRHEFDLQQGPLLHLRYFPLGEDRAALVLTAPALLIDAFGIGLFIEQTALAYKGVQGTTEEPLRYVQFAQWQSDILDSTDENASNARRHWGEAIADAGGTLPLLHDKRESGEFRPGTVSATTNLRFGALEGSVEVVLHAAWQALLWRLTGEGRFLTRLYVDGREYDELRTLLGPVGKFVPIPARFDGDFCFRDVVDRLVRSHAGALQWQEYFRPGAGADDGLAAAFEFGKRTSVQDAGAATFVLTKRSVCSERFSVKLSALHGANGIQIDLHYDAGRFGKETAARWLQHFLTLLEAAVARPETLVSRLPLLTASERHKILHSWNRTETEYRRDLCFHQLFERQVERTPDRMAVRAAGQQLTYDELNRRANRLAWRLQEHGIGPGSRIALLLDRGVDALAVILASLKAGAAYIPLNLDNPKARLSQHLRIADALISESNLAAQLPQFSGPRILIDYAGPNGKPLSEANPVSGATPEDLCYIIFTSGSTGGPKAVAVRHRNLVNYATFITVRLNLEAWPDQLQFATVSTLSADLGNTCIFPALLSGGCIHLISQEIAGDPVKFATYQRELPLDVLKIVPSHLEALLDSPEGPSLLPRKILITGGESLTARLAERIRHLQSGCALLNHYGPTETTIGSLTFPLTPEDALIDPVPVGRPIANTKAYILDSYRQPVPVGVRGDLYIAGDGVSAGYLNDPNLTADRFIQDPFAGGTMYRTGDYARYREDGNIVFAGRQDNQVKIRGFRVELGEVETALVKHPGVKQAVVVARRPSLYDASLIAYVVPQTERPGTSAEIRDFLRSELPDYMIPGIIGFLPKLPLTSNGKLDRINLPEPVEVEQRIPIAPRNTTEHTVIAIWAEVFRRNDIGVQDDFFDLGGHSLMATQIMSRIRERFNVILEMRILFQFPTVEGLATAVLSARPNPVVAREIVPVRRELYRRK